MILRCVEANGGSLITRLEGLLVWDSVIKIRPEWYRDMTYDWDCMYQRHRLGLQPKTQPSLRTVLWTQAFAPYSRFITLTKAYTPELNAIGHIQWTALTKVFCDNFLNRYECRLSQFVVSKPALSVVKDSKFKVAQILKSPATDALYSTWQSILK